MISCSALLLHCSTLHRTALGGRIALQVIAMRCRASTAACASTAMECTAENLWQMVVMAMKMTRRKDLFALSPMNKNIWQINSILQLWLDLVDNVTSAMCKQFLQDETWLPTFAALPLESGREADEGIRWAGQGSDGSQTDWKLKMTAMGNFRILKIFRSENFFNYVVS